MRTAIVRLDDQGRQLGPDDFFVHESGRSLQLSRATVEVADVTERVLLVNAAFPGDLPLATESLPALVEREGPGTLGAVVRDYVVGRVTADPLPEHASKAFEIAAAAAIMYAVGSWDESPTISVTVNDAAIPMAPRFDGGRWTATLDGESTLPDAAGEPSAERVLEIARLIHAHARLEDDDLVQRLRADGLSEMEAELAIIFLPIAFGRPILLKAGVEDFAKTYLVQDRTGAWVEHALADEPWFRAALRVGVSTVTHGYSADGCMGETAGRAEFQSVMSRSPEVGAISQLLDAGEDVRGATFQPLRLLRITAEALRPPPSPPPPAAPRWQFWRRR